MRTKLLCRWNGRRWLAAMGCLATWSAIPVAADSVTKTPVADAYVRSSDPTGYHGGDTSLIANNNNGVRVSYLRFDMSDITNAITRMKLELTVSIASAGNTFHLFGLTNSAGWNETQINWQNAPGIINSFSSASGTEAQYFRMEDTYGGGPLAAFTSTAAAAGQVDTVFDVASGPILNYAAAGLDKTSTWVILEQDPVDIPGNAWNAREAANGQPRLTVYFGSNAPAVSPAILKVYLQGGQSNSDGRALTNGLAPALLQPQNDLPFYYYLTGGATNSDGSLGGLTFLRPGASALGGGTTFGPELSFGRTLADYFATTNGASTNTVMVAIIKYAHGGTTLAGDWLPGGDATTNGDGRKRREPGPSIQ